MKTMLTILTATMLLSATVVAKEPCKIENWKYEAAGGGPSFFYIHGTTTCRSGKIIIRMYEGEDYIGNETVYAEGHAFKVVVQGKAPNKMTIKYTIE